MQRELEQKKILLKHYFFNFFFFGGGGDTFVKNFFLGKTTSFGIFKNVFFFGNF